MVTEHYAGLKVQQRGLTYYVTRTSNVRNTASYELYNYILWNNSPGGAAGENPKMSYSLFSEKWYPWVTVPHNV